MPLCPTGGQRDEDPTASLLGRGTVCDEFVPVSPSSVGSSAELIEGRLCHQADRCHGSLLAHLHIAETFEQRGRLLEVHHDQQEAQLFHDGRSQSPSRQAQALVQREAPRTSTTVRLGRSRPGNRSRVRTPSLWRYSCQTWRHRSFSWRLEFLPEWAMPPNSSNPRHFMAITAGAAPNFLNPRPPRFLYDATGTMHRLRFVARPGD